MIMGIMKSFVFKLLLVGFAFAGACACGKTDRVDLEEELDPEVVDFIAKKITNNVRQLEGTVKKMMGPEMALSIRDHMR